MEPVTARSRWPLWAGVLAPASFIGAWAVCGALRPGYDPVEEAISQLARVGTPHRLGMTAGFVGFGLLLPVFARRLPGLLAAGPGVRRSATLAGVATLAVAAFPLHREAGGDGLHIASAAVGYLAMAATPALAVAPLERAHRHTPSRLSALTSAASMGALLASVTTGPTGLWQRAGLGVVDLWFVVVAASALRSRPGLAARGVRSRVTLAPDPDRAA